MRETGIPGCVVRSGPVHRDERGWFVKPFQASAFAGTDPVWAECFATESARGVVRGFHLQLPPVAHAKLVWAAAGAARSVVLDLRAGSPSYGKAVPVDLRAGEGDALFVPPGVAHAFQARDDGTVLVYLVTSEHDATRDAGVRWDSAGVEWPLPVTTVSARDRALPALAEFATPFRYTP